MFGNGREITENPLNHIEVAIRAFDPCLSCATHALDLQDRRRVLFVNASIDAPAPCSLELITAAKDASFTTHAMSPQAVLKVYANIEDGKPPPCWLLAIRGERFELGEELTEAGQQSLQAALQVTANRISP